MADRTPYLARAEPRSRLPFLAEKRHAAQDYPGGRVRARHSRRVLQGAQRHRQQGADRHALHHRVVSAFSFIFHACGFSITIVSMYIFRVLSTKIRKEGWQNSWPTTSRVLNAM